MKISDKVIEYVDGNLSPAERVKFEEELKKSSVLQAEVNSYKDLLSQAESVKSVPVDEDYFTSIIPEFRITSI